MPVDSARDSASRRVAVVTGAARGLGAALARETTARGMAVVLADRNGKELAAVADELRTSGAEVLDVATDIGDPASIDALASEVRDKFGAVTLLINNAGIELVGKIWEFSAAELDQIVRINLLGAMHLVHAFVPDMIANASPSRIVNVASLGALGAMPLQTAYIVTKYALLAFSEGLELELRQFAPHVRTSVVLPGAIDTSIFEESDAGDSLNGIFAAVMRRMLSWDGLSPAEAAHRIMTQVDEGCFWISSHADQLSVLAKARGQRLAMLAEPYLDEGGQWLMREIGH